VRGGQRIYECSTELVAGSMRALDIDRLGRDCDLGTRPIGESRTLSTGCDDQPGKSKPNGLQH